VSKGRRLEYSKVGAVFSQGLWGGEKRTKSDFLGWKTKRLKTRKESDRPQRKWRRHWERGVKDRLIVTGMSVKEENKKANRGRKGHAEKKEPCWK